ncbi:MAG: hypothetical protein ACREJC_02150, partial [Tepidisphaeraceae bacterium]
MPYNARRAVASLADPLRLAASHALERLEARVLLSSATDVFDVRNTPVFVPTSDNVRDVQHGPMANAGKKLIDVYLNYRKAQKDGEAYDPGPDNPIDFRGDTVGVKIRARGKLSPLVFAMRGIGMKVTSYSRDYGVIEGYLPITLLREVATRPDVASVNPIYRPITMRQGIANNQADDALNSVDVRTTFGLKGEGVKIGVISDSANNVGSGLDGSVGTKDLPKGIEIVEDSDFGTDEGRAMMELIHDIAPKAKLAFNTGTGGQQAFADAITALKDVGSDIIVDDLAYRDEPYFQPGVIDGSIKSFVAGGGIYVSAVGNSAREGFEQSASYSTIGGKTFIDFDPSAGVDRRMDVTFNENTILFFGWDNPYNGLSGTVTADMDIRFFRSSNGNLADEATDNNFATGIPLEGLFLDAGAYEVEIELDRLQSGASRPTIFKITADGMGNAQYTG